MDPPRRKPFPDFPDFWPKISRSGPTNVFSHSGYKENDLRTIREKALTKSTTNPGRNSENLGRNSDNTGDELVFPVYYFHQLNAFKSVKHSMKTESETQIGW